MLRHTTTALDCTLHKYYVLLTATEAPVMPEHYLVCILLHLRSNNYLD